jgi:signal transduction histidine kinase
VQESHRLADTTARRAARHVRFAHTQEATMPPVPPKPIPPAEQAADVTATRSHSTNIAAATARPETRAATAAVAAHAVERHLDALEYRFADLQKQTQQLQKLSVMGTMSAMLAHEVKNLLTPVVSYAQYALDRNDQELMQKAVESALKNARNAADLCERIMRMAGDEDDASDCALRPVIEDALACLGRGLERDGINLLIEVDPAIRVRMNPIDLQQVLYNLAINARQAMLDRGGSLTIRAASADGRITLTVTDTGCGIRSDELERIFEPFFSTKRGEDRPDRRGAGLGMTICRQLIENSGGMLEVASRWGEGTAFSLTLPAA